MIRAVLVDDEPPARVRMRQLLEAAGGVSVVGEAGNADEARDVIRNTRPDLLFLDVEMPEVRGTALAASLPEPRPFIVFATAFDRGRYARALAYGRTASEIMQNPQLQDKVRALFGADWAPPTPGAVGKPTAAAPEWWCSRRARMVATRCAATGL